MSATIKFVIDYKDMFYNNKIDPRLRKEFRDFIVNR